MAVYTTINDPSAHFQTTLYTGNSTGRSITNTGNANLQPDWIWIKNRTGGADWHDLTDSTRGVTKTLFTNVTNAQGTAAQSLQAFLTDGFTIGTDPQVNRDANGYAAWQWKATAGTTATNNAGSLSSTVQANTTAGFSIVKWTSDGNNGRTVGHGLGVKPTVIITKNISAVGSWYSFFEAAGVDKYLTINNTNAVATNTDIFGGGAQATAVFTIGQSAAGYSNGNDIIAYVFAPIQGYSKFGGYTGSSDRPFVYTGFKPAWLMVKRTDSSTNANWYIVDNKRNTFNVLNLELYANESSAENTRTAVDFLSNGFKIRTSASGYNADGSTYIYMAFAENPFVTSDGVPTTAR